MTDWSAAAPLLALVGAVLVAMGAIWHRLGRMEHKIDTALRALREHTHADGSPATAPIPADTD